MSAEIIVLPVIRIERCESNGAREALIEIGKNCPFHVEEGRSYTSHTYPLKVYYPLPVGG